MYVCVRSSWGKQIKLSTRIKVFLLCVQNRRIIPTKFFVIQQFDIYSQQGKYTPTIIGVLVCETVERAAQHINRSSGIKHNIIQGQPT